ncbi:MAG: porin family protein [Cytophaga sp.]|uniref:porin family protein n=1 Tax=Cytophaga sp. TaxID=29535 RepID=UPI003F7CF40B
MRFPLAICLVLFLYVFLPVEIQAQVHRKKPGHSSGLPDDDFTKTQFYIGMRGGISLTKANVLERYSSFVSTTDPDQTYDKEYKNYSKAGAFVGLEFDFYFKGFTASFQPNYRRQIYSYSNNYEWRDTSDASNFLQLEYNQDTRLDYIELPLFIKYDILKKGFRPFVQVGFYYGILNGATKHLIVDGTDNASGTARHFNQQDEIVGAKDLFIKSSIGMAYGIGCSYKVGNVRLVLDATYRMGMNNITNVSNRYSANALSGAGDVSDDLKLNNIAFSFACLFPMKFLTSPQYKAVD